MARIGSWGVHRPARFVLAGLVVALAVTTGAPAGSATPPAPPAVVDLGDDHRVHLDGGPAIPASRLGTPRAVGGFALLEAGVGLQASYVVRPVTDHAAWRDLEDMLETAALRLTASTGASYRLGTPRSSHTNTNGEITVSFTSGPKCGDAGCADTWLMGFPPDMDVVRAEVWVNPDLATDEMVYDTLLHELGHAAGLSHYDADHEGSHQIMRSFVMESDSLGEYQGGDLNGLARTAANGFAQGTLLARPCRQLIIDVRVTNTFCPDIGWLVDEEISSAYADGTFRPSTKLSRQAMAAFLYRMAGEPPPPPDPPAFSDVPAASQFADAIAWMVAEGITTGYPDGTFRPTAGLSRQSMAAFLHRMAGEPAPVGSPPSFSDVPASHAFRPAIAWMATTGVTTGYPDGSFRPTLPVSRGSMAAFLHRYAELP